MTLAAGTKLGRYEIRSKLGEGGMGEVYLALDTKLDRKVALKILPAEVAAHPDRMKRFVQEAKSASALNHPNIITIYEIEQIDSLHFIATEFIDGQTLRQRLKNGPLKIGEMLEVAIHAASALAAAHAAGIVHRDIKPENIMLRRDGIVKVLDFGLAKLSEPPAVAGGPAVDTEAATRVNVKTDPGVVMGTAHYMSPEQARGLGVDARTDIFSLGVVLYEMVAGRAPFEGATQSDVLVSILDREPPPLARFAPEAPAELERIVTKALAKDREARYQTMKDLAIDLRALKQRLELEAEIERTRERRLTAGAQTENATQILAARPTSSAEYVAGGLKKYKPAAVAALLFLLLAVGGISLWHSRQHPVNAAQIESIAVLPFVNESGNSDVEYLSDGMTESLINNLSQLPKLNVKARSTVFRYKGKDADGRNQKQLTDDAFYKRSFSVTPDGRYIVFDSLRSGTQQLWRIDIDGSNLKQLTMGIGAFSPHCSADGKWVVYNSFTSSGFIIWKISIDGGEPMRVTNNQREYASLPAVSPDGKLITCYFFDQQTRVTKIALLPFDGGDPVKLFDLPQTAIRGEPVRWTPDGRALTYINTRGIVSNIWLQPIDGGPPKQLTNFKTDRIFSFDWSHDGKQLALSRGTEDRDVILINNLR